MCVREHRPFSSKPSSEALHGPCVGRPMAFYQKTFACVATRPGPAAADLRQNSGIQSGNLFIRKCYGYLKKNPACNNLLSKATSSPISDLLSRIVRARELEATLILLGQLSSLVMCRSGTRTWQKTCWQTGRSTGRLPERVWRNLEPCNLSHHEGRKRLVIVPLKTVEFPPFSKHMNPDSHLLLLHGRRIGVVRSQQWNRADEPP